MTSAGVRMKLLCCIWVYALIALFSATNAQDNGTDYRENKREPQDKNKTNEFESTTGQSFTPDPTVKEGNGTNVTTTAVYDLGDKGTNTSTDNNIFPRVNDSVTDYPDLNGTDVGKGEEENGGNLTTAKRHPETVAETPLPVDPETKANKSWGYVILILILLLILALCIILFYMRRVTRSYSFDLQRPAPVRTNEPIGTFEPVYLDDLDYQIHSVGNASVDEANGTVLSNEDKKEPSGGEAENDEPQTNGLQTVPPESSPNTQTEPDQDQVQQDQLDQDQSPSPILFIQESDEETNGNNNNSPTVRSSDPFVEINLEEPQQMSTSSVQPFSPSIFSSLS